MAYETSSHDDGEMITVHPNDDGTYEGRRGEVVVKAKTPERALEKILKQTHERPPDIPIEKTK